MIAKCRKCGQEFIDSLDIAVHLGLKSDIYPPAFGNNEPCPKGATKKDIGN